MSSIAVIHYKPCVSCGRVFKEMRQIGSLVMCPSCMKEIFVTDNPIDQEREKYLSWLKVQDVAESKIE